MLVSVTLGFILYTFIRQSNCICRTISLSYLFLFLCTLSLSLSLSLSLCLLLILSPSLILLFFSFSYLLSVHLCTSPSLSYLSYPPSLYTCSSFFHLFYPFFILTLWSSVPVILTSLYPSLSPYIYIYIYIVSSPDRLFRWITTLQCG